MKRKGIILAGGTGSRLHPSTISVSKQLMPVYDKPMIYYPLSVLIQAGVREILVIVTPEDEGAFRKLLRDGSQWGLDISYATQSSPDGIAQALIIAEDFLAGSSCILILGDNLFFGRGFSGSLKTSMARQAGATIFGFQVSNPSDYGVVGFDKHRRAVSLVEKPENPASNYAVTGIYFYDSHASSYAKTITPSARGELEITALNQIYLDRGELTVELLEDGTTWLDTGTHKSLHAAAQFVAVLEDRQGIRICCPEIEAFKQGWINHNQLSVLADQLINSGYGRYLKAYAKTQHV